MKLKINSCDGVYENSLDVRFTKFCDNDCSFCIDKLGVASQGDTDINALALSTLRSGRREILILGGEPMLLPGKLLGYISLIRPHVDKIYITTSLPKNVTPLNPIILAILNRIDGLNVSLHHYDYKKNNEVLNASSPHDRVTQLGELLKYESFASKIRVSVNLVKGVIDSREDLDRYIETIKKLGGKHIKITELQHVPADMFVSFEEIYGTNLLAPYVYGCQTNETDLIGKDINITLKRSCYAIKHINIAKATWKDLVKELVRVVFRVNKSKYNVVYEDGTLTRGWIQRGGEVE